MPAAPIAVHSDARTRTNVLVGLLALGAGFLGHVLAARAIGGTFSAYRDHLVGFAGLTIVSGAALALAGRFLWKGRHDVTLLVLGLLQASIGLFVYMERFSVHG